LSRDVRSRSRENVMNLVGMGRLRASLCFITTNAFLIRGAQLSAVGLHGTEYLMGSVGPVIAFRWRKKRTGEVDRIGHQRVRAEADTRTNGCGRGRDSFWRGEIHFVAGGLAERLAEAPARRTDDDAR
jgi:hypothetical protein